MEQDALVAAHIEQLRVRRRRPGAVLDHSRGDHVHLTPLRIPALASQRSVQWPRCYAVLLRAVALPQNVISQNRAGLTVASQIRSSHLDTIR
jgi:hypothetical protein